MKTKSVITFKSQNRNSSLQIIDLVNLYKIDHYKFLNLFEEAHKIYCDSFPKYEQESKNQILAYIKESANSLKTNYSIGSHNFLVLLNKKIPQGIHSLDFMLNNKGDFGVHTGPLAINKTARGKGLSSILVNVLIQRTKFYALQEQLNPLGLIGDVDLFNYPEEINNYSARLKFHHNHLGFGAAVIIDKNNYAKLVPYGSPGIIKNGKSAEIMKFIMAITPFTNGSIKKILVMPGKIISPSGKLLVNKNILQKISKEKILDMQKMIYDSYGNPCNNETYSLEQISRMRNESEKALKEVDELYLIPIMDTRYLN